MKVLSYNMLMLLIAASLSLFCSCRKNTGGLPNPDLPKSMDDLTIPADFNFSSLREVTMKLKLPFTIDYTTHRGVVKILTAPEENEGKLLYTGAVDQSGYLEITISIPAWYDSLFIWTEAGSLWYNSATRKSTSAHSDEIINFGNGYGTTPPADTSVLLKNQPDFSSMEINGMALADHLLAANLVKNGEFNQNDFKSFPDWSSPMLLDGKWYKTNTLNSNAIQYNDNGNNVLRITTPTSSGYRSGGVAQLVTSYPGDILTFSTDFKFSGTFNTQNRAWLYLIPRNTAGQSIAFYNLEIANVNTKTSWARYTVMATMPMGTSTVQVLLWHWTFSGAMYWDNVVVTGKINDSDGDGVNDEQDEYPDDNQRAFNMYYPSRNSFNTIAFEDNWPKKGDYDFNDLVTDYQFKQVTNSTNKLVELFGIFILRAAGAGYTNGFGFQMNLPASEVVSVQGCSYSESYINLLASGVEAGQEKATIILTDNVFSQLPIPAGGGIGVNTEPGKPYVMPDTMFLQVALTSPVPLSQTGSPPYNPFLIINGERGREVHLPGMAGTNLANNDYFGTWDDASDPASGRYYKTASNLPWAINIPASFIYPTEKTIILEGYLKFGDWAESAGTLYPDWYLDFAGYRNNAALFQVPD